MWRTPLGTGGKTFAAVAVVVVLAACGTTETTTAPATGVPGTSEEVRESGQFGLAADVIGGGALALDEALASGPIALWFWAPG